MIFGAVAFDDPEHAATAKGVFTREGYAVELQSQADGSVVLVATPSTLKGTESALVEWMRLLASDFGGEFLGRGGSEQYPLRGHS
jgi:hypothetical protein